VFSVCLPLSRVGPTKTFCLQPPLSPGALFLCFPKASPRDYPPSLPTPRAKLPLLHGFMRKQFFSSLPRVVHGVCVGVSSLKRTQPKVQLEPPAPSRERETLPCVAPDFPHLSRVSARALPSSFKLMRICFGSLVFVFSARSVSSPRKGVWCATCPCLPFCMVSSLGCFDFLF